MTERRVGPEREWVGDEPDRWATSVEFYQIVLDARPWNYWAPPAIVRLPDFNEFMRRMQGGS